MLDDKIAGYIDILSICIGFAALVLFFALAYVVKRNWNRCWEDACGVWIMAPVITGAVAFIVACVALLDIWNWVAVFNPKIALFHDILTKFLSK